MNKPAAVLLTLVLAITAVSVPIWFAVRQSERQAFETVSAQAMAYARDVLLRADETGDQITAGVERLARDHAAHPCSAASIDAMREIDVGSSYIQAIGHVRGDTLVCSSIAGNETALALGPVDYRTKAGAAFRRNVRFPFAPQRSFVVVEIKHFAAIIHKDLPIDTAKSASDVSLAVLSAQDPAPTTARGYIDRAWLGRLGSRTEAVFEDGPHIVAVVRSKRYLTVAVAAVPLRYLRDRSSDVAQRLVPIGLAAGVLLTLAILHLARSQMALPAAVRTALRRKELFLEYQPVVDLRTGRWVGAEALLRWRRPTGEVVQPDLFIPIAEQHGMIVRVTRRVLERVCEDAGAYLAGNPDFHIAINVSAGDFHDPDFLEGVHAALRGMGAAPASLVLEITERSLLDPDVARSTTGALRRSGFALAIDDFGTGYSSLSYLESLELDYLKIDRSFIEAIGTEAPTSQVVQHIIAIARDLDLRMIAEGVESHAQADSLRARGVQYAQGWLFGKPMPFAALAEQLERQRRQEALAANAG
ncbi:EAL domain-containing protein [Massilia sp. ST3]|uniref:EAL domain-containing protein n=1 Tax=Massilia sp. ST3 TaxID=2824903 RepID=UPI001B813139|nr:EAL domain-containing protein [Massilia sp. ST3]MBQ5949185.1 EAL domain-containing protein [Massilia sp. ST3]